MTWHFCGRQLPDSAGKTPISCSNGLNGSPEDVQEYSVHANLTSTKQNPVPRSCFGLSSSMRDMSWAKGA